MSDQDDVGAGKLVVLENFRSQWQKELNEKNKEEIGEKQVTNENSEDDDEEEDDIHRKARDLFMKGVEFEGDGKFFDAIKYYKMAEKLVPDIEIHAHKFNIAKKNNMRGVKNTSVEDANGNAAPETNELDLIDLISKFSKLKVAGDCSIKNEFETNSVHIGRLPSEVLNYIIKWVVSSDLDLKSLENCSEVCRGFYLASRDEEIWRLIFSRMWGSVVVIPASGSWRELFLTRPRIHFNGCYVSRIKYLREGERGFQDQETYRAWHVVEYNRFLRFFPGGQVIMAMSSDDEAIVAKQLNTKAGGMGIPGAIMGRYRIANDVLICVLHKPKPLQKKTTKFKRKGRKEIENTYYEVPEQDFHMEFNITGTKWRMLEWKHYSLVSKFTNGNENVDNFQTRDQNKYPRLRFKPVGSYQFESLSPLQ